MEVLKFEIEGPLLLMPSKVADDRGFVSETYSFRQLEPYIGPHSFVQDNHALSQMAGTIRGLHFQIAPATQGKLVRVVRGAAYDVAVDIRVGSPTYGRYVAVELSAANWGQFWVPIGFAHGFCTLEPQTEVVYKLTGYYSPQHDRGLAWNDPSLGIPWPVVGGAASLSPRDQAQSSLANLPAYFQWMP